ncbi:MAG: hypothetical protein R3F17_11640 [Planctomycetota bacterium]
MNAGDVVNDLVPRTFDQAEAELNALRGATSTRSKISSVWPPCCTDDIRAREAQGLVGYVRGRTDGVETPVREAVMRALVNARAPSPARARPVRVQGGMLLLCLGERAVAPTWDIMAQNVHKVLRRRFMIEQLSPSLLKTYLDK